MSRLRAFLLILALAAQFCVAQTAPQPANPQTPVPQVTPGTGNAPPKAKIEITVPSPEPQAPHPQTSSGKITPEQAEELFKSVDEMLQWVSEETGLPIRQPVKRELRSRPQVETYVRDKMTNDEDARRLERSIVVLKKFGLIERDFDLAGFMIKLLGEQVVGYYDPKTKTVYLLDWVEPIQQKPVLAHELTHALQDQAVDLDKWLRAGEPDEKEANQPTPADPAEEQRWLQKQIDSDESSTARQAVSEGQGMAVLVDYSLAPLGRKIVDSPELVDMMRNSMASGSDSPIFDRAPPFLREVLTFPYKYGLGFEQALLMKGGKQAAFANALQNPPQTTRHVMEPGQYLKGEQIPRLLIPAVGHILGPGWEKLDVGAMGQLDAYLLLDQYANTRTAQRLAPAWRGGYYYAALKKGAEKPNKALGTGAVGIFYVSRWGSEAEARDFAAAYANSFLTRYRNVWPKKKKGKVDILWDTNEGPMLVEQVGDTVVVSESFDAKSARKLRDAALAGGGPASGAH